VKFRNDLDCRNCGTSAPGRYCPECGQETDPTPPTFSEFVKQFFGNYIAVKGSLIQTLWRLVSRPGALTADYLDGRRRRYVLPLRFYLTVSVIVFIIFGLLTSFTTTEMVKIDAKDLSSGNVVFFSDEHSIKFKDGAIECKGIPDWLCRRANAKFGSKASLQTLITTLPERMIRYWAYAMFILVPLYAALLKLLYVRRGRTYGEHIVFALHIHTMWLLLALLAMAHDTISGFALLAMPVYTVLALRRVYRDGWFKVVIRSALISLIYLVLASIAVAVVAIIALFA
jgi:Protein of unknown function (DUF3667)